MVGGGSVFDAGGQGPQYLLVPAPFDRFYSSRYGYVFSGFAGLESGRRPLATRGTYTVAERAPIDVAVVRTGYSIDPADGARAIPWVTVPFEFWISSSPSNDCQPSHRPAAR